MSTVTLAPSSFRSFHLSFFFSFFFNDTATTEIYTLSLHDALPILATLAAAPWAHAAEGEKTLSVSARSEEHTSELQSQSNLVCRLLLDKKDKNRLMNNIPDYSNGLHARSRRAGGT